jgi:hypothetical protein
MVSLTRSLLALSVLLLTRCIAQSVPLPVAASLQFPLPLLPTMAAPRNAAVGAPSGVLAPTEFVVAATPQQHLVYTNHIYIADDPSNAKLLTKRAGQTDTYALVNERLVYVVRPHKGVAPGDVGLSSIQRETCQVSSGEKTKVAYWEQPVDGRADLVTLKLDVELIGTKRSHVAAAELAPVLVKNFVGQVFTTGQIFCCDFQGESGSENALAGSPCASV